MGLLVRWENKVPGPLLQVLMSATIESPGGVPQSIEAREERLRLREQAIEARERILQMFLLGLVEQAKVQARMTAILMGTPFEEPPVAQAPPRLHLVPKPATEDVS